MCNDDVIRIVSTNCVPVAVNLYLTRTDKGPGGELFRSVQRQMDQYQGFWMVSPDGKALGKYHDWNGDPAKVVLNGNGRPYDPGTITTATGTGTGTGDDRFQGFYYLQALQESNLLLLGLPNIL